MGAQENSIGQAAKCRMNEKAKNWRRGADGLVKYCGVEFCCYLVCHQFLYHHSMFSACTLSHQIEKPRSSEAHSNRAMGC